jgi:hypothetical protein
MAEKPYPKIDYVVKRESTVLQCNRIRDKVIEVPRDTPGNIILVHGVNDVGMGYSAAEEGLCAGLQERLFRYFKPAGYTLPTEADKNKVEADPDAVYFKRQVRTDTDSPVIPFYWGYTEVLRETRTKNGQKTDRYGTRLDKDLSKGGGPFGNATGTLPDMWNRGVLAAGDPVGDALRPIKTGPGRMYMVLAAQRLAALIGMIRKFEPKDTVSIVAHSQGCLLTLLAQAFLMERGERTADTLILTHPPYSLDEEMSLVMKGLTFFRGGTDKAMDEAQYELIDGRQSMHARLQTLVNIVAGVTKSKAAVPAFAKLNESDCGGMVASCWEPGGDRDNRGKVYLYFCPEDMTVALDNMRGIGWQGVPDYLHTVSLKRQVQSGYAMSKAGYQDRHSIVTRKPMAELGASFFQRVFTAKHRLEPRTGKTAPVLVGQAPHDFALCIRGEDGHAHVAASARSLREKLPVATWPISQGDKPEAQRYGIRWINAEPLHPPCVADLRGNQIAADKIPASSRLAKVPLNERGPSEEVDPITAAIAVTGLGGMDVALEELPPAVASACAGDKPGRLSKPDCERMQAAYNEAKFPKKVTPDNSYAILSASRRSDGKVVAYVMESPDAARKRWQQELGEKSFHSAIFDSAANHRNVTAYDVAIGSGKASSHRLFYAYLCAVADWRLKKPGSGDKGRKEILTWEKFVKLHGTYYECEPDWRKQLLKGNVDYYSYGVLPSSLPVLTGKLWDIVISETTTGRRVSQPAAPKGQS